MYYMPSQSTITVKVNIPSQNCVYSITPLEGKSLTTDFSISIKSCLDEQLPLTYKYLYYTSSIQINVLTDY